MACLPAAAALAAAAVLFHPVLGGRVVGGHTASSPLFRDVPQARPAATLRDIEIALLPFRAATHSHVEEGRVPLWSPWTGCGAPLLGNQQSQALHPFTWVGLLVDWRAALTVVMALTFVLAFGGTYLLARVLGIAPEGAAAAACAFTLSGFVAERLMYPVGGALVHAPLLLALALRAGREPTVRHGVLLAAALASSILIGHFEYLPVLWAVTGVACVVASRGGTPGGWTRRGATSAGGLVLASASGALLLAGAMFFPSVEYLSRSIQMEKRATLSRRDPFGPRAPAAAGAPPRGRLVSVPSQAASPTLYIGTGVVVLAAAGIGSRRGLRLALAAAILGALLTDWPVALAIWKVPPLSFMVRHRINVLAMLLVSLLVGLGVVARASRAARWLAAAGLAVAIAMALLESGSWQSPRSRSGVAAAVATAVLAVAAVSLGPRGPLGAVFALAVLVGSRAPHAGVHNRFSRPADLFPPLPHMRQLADAAGHDRVLGQGFANAAMVYGYREVTSYDAVGVGSYEKALQAARAAGMESGARFARAAAARVVVAIDRRGELAGPVLGRVGDAVFVEDPAAVPRARLLSGRGAVRFERDEPHRVAIRVEAAGADRLLLADVAFPGWRARLDGAEVPWRPEGLFRGVDVPAGSHLLEMVYVPASYRVGLFATLVAVLGMMALLPLSGGQGHGRFRPAAPDGT